MSAGRALRLDQLAENVAQALLKQQRTGLRRLAVVIEDVQPAWWVQFELAHGDRVIDALEHVLVVRDSALSVVD